MSAKFTQKSIVAMAQLHELNLKFLSRSLYFPDQTPSDYYVDVFANLKKVLRERDLNRNAREASNSLY